MEPTQPQTTPQPGGSPQPASSPDAQPQTTPGQVVNNPNTSPLPPQTPTGPATPPGFGQPPIGSPPPSGGVNRKRLVIIVVCVIVAVILAAVTFLARNNSNNPVSNVTSKITDGNSDVVDRSDGTLDLGTLIDSQQTIKSQELKAKLNQQVNLSDGRSYMVTSVERNFATTSRFLKADANKELIKVNLVIGNRDKQLPFLVFSRYFQIRNSAGGVQDPEYAKESDVAGVLTNQTIEPGKQIKGSIIFQVDKDEQVTLVTSGTYEKHSGQEEATLKSEVSLQ